MKDKCAGCKHCLEVFDQSNGRYRGACSPLHLIVGLESRACHTFFEPRVPQVPYIPGSLPRVLEVELVEEIRLHMLKVEELLTELELQPRYGTPPRMSYKEAEAQLRRLLREQRFHPSPGSLRPGWPT